MRIIPWLGTSAALVAGYVAGAASPSGDSERAEGPRPPSAPAPPQRRAPADSPDEELARALRSMGEQAQAGPELAAGAPIVGTVLDDASQPVAGVVVRARPEIDPPDDDDDESPIADVAVRRLGWLQRVRGGTRSTTTASDGTFSIDGVRSGLTYEVDVRTEGFEVDTDDSSGTSEVSPGDSVSLVVVRRCALLVSIDGGSGPPPEVEIAGPDQSADEADFSDCAWSTARPTLWVRPGRWLVRARAGDSVTEVVAATAEFGGLADARLTLVAAGRIECDVAWPAGVDREDVRIVATRSGGDCTRDENRGERRADGGLTFRGLTPGRWTVAVAYPSHRVVDTRDVTVAAGGCVRLRLDLPEPDARDFVVVRVLDAEGLPVSGAAITSIRHYGCCSSWEGPGAVESSPGVYRAFHAETPEPDHWFYVRVRVGSEYETVDYEPGRDAEVVARVACTAPLDVRIGQGFNVTDTCASDRSETSAGEDGIAHVGKRRPGDVLLVRDDDLDAGMVVRVPVPGVVEWAPQPLRAFRVWSVDEGPGGDAGLCEGDLVVGVDGEEFRDAPHRDVVWAAALARGRCRLDVVRSGDGASVAMDASLFRNGRAKVRLVPWVR